MAIYKNGELYRGDSVGVEKALTSGLEVNHGIAALVMSNARTSAINEIVKKIASINRYELDNDAKMKVIEKILLEPEE